VGKLWSSCSIFAFWLSSWRRVPWHMPRRHGWTYMKMTSIINYWESAMSNARCLRNRARETWIDRYEDDEYDELLMECYQKCQLPKKPNHTRHRWQCLYCKKVFKGRPGLNYHWHKGCPTAGHCLKMYITCK